MAAGLRKRLLTKTSNMRHISMLIVALSISLINYGQDITPETKLPFRDSILLNEFWTKFTAAVKMKDEVKLEALCRFPFFCRPCISDTALKNNNHVTIMVTRQIFRESQYKLFFDRSIRNEINKRDSFCTNIFTRAVDNHLKPNGFSFSYTIIAPSKGWEGLQGFIYIRKINGGYKITGIDTVP